MHVKKSKWIRGALLFSALGIICTGISVSTEAHGRGGQGAPNCATPHMNRAVGIRMSGKTITLTGDPVSACGGDIVQWNNTTNKRQTFQLVFTKDPFRKTGKYTVAAGRKLSVSVPVGAAPGTYEYSICARSCSLTSAVRLDPHVIIMGQ
jgi:plastocyanin